MSTVKTFGLFYVHTMKISVFVADMSELMTCLLHITAKNSSGATINPVNWINSIKMTYVRP